MPTREAPPVYRGYVFGLEVESSLALPAASPPVGDHRPKVFLKEVSSGELAGAWRPRDAISIVHWRSVTGRLVLSIDSHAELGYRIAAPAQGRYLVSKDGREIRAVLPAVPAWRWQRLFFAQVLPLAAALHGLSPFHASAVALGDRALGFIASSGAGKTSIAAYLTSCGASFMTDDVMALGSSADGVRVHPGPGVARIRSRELRAIGPHARDRFGEVLGRSDKIQLAIQPMDRAVSLGALYFLERSSRFVRLKIIERRPADPLRALASSFVSYVQKPEFLLAHLDVCTHIARSVPTFDVSIPEPVSGVDVARRIAGHVEGWPVR